MSDNDPAKTRGLDVGHFDQFKPGSFTATIGLGTVAVGGVMAAATVDGIHRMHADLAKLREIRQRAAAGRRAAAIRLGQAWLDHDAADRDLRQALAEAGLSEGQ